ncbi:MAG: hypothetical protein HY222_06220 [Thaumarchaeota archaeon]|nr:hypothetical protein [Nitrososphaerota archaeon]MBI3641972.1 hypothetical protein [Nitrososphaerota archaeon]
MKEIDLGRAKTCEFSDHIIIGLDKKFLKLNHGKPLVFDAKINEKNQLVLSATLPTNGDKTNISTRGEIDGSN